MATKYSQKCIASHTRLEYLRKKFQFVQYFPLPIQLMVCWRNFMPNRIFYWYWKSSRKSLQSRGVGVIAAIKRYCVLSCIIKIRLYLFQSIYPWLLSYVTQRIPIGCVIFFNEGFLTPMYLIMIWTKLNYQLTRLSKP